MKKAVILFVLISCYLLPGVLRAQNINWAAGGTGGCEGWTEAVDPWGNVFMAGFNNPAGDTLIFGPNTITGYGEYTTVLVKYNANGALMWAAHTHAGTTRPLGVAADAQGNAYLLAWYADTAVSIGSVTLTNPGATIGSVELYITKYTPAGAVAWAKNICNIISGALPFWYEEAGIAVNGPDIYITSEFNSPVVNVGPYTLNNSDPSGTTFDLLVARLDSSANVTWAKSAGNSTGDDITNAIAVAPSGNVYVTGTFTSPSFSIGAFPLTKSGHTSLFLAKYDAAGNVLWAKTPTGNIHDDGRVNGGLATDSAENAYITGTYDTVNLLFGSYTLTPDTMLDAYVAKYDATGNVVWAKKANGNKNIDGYGVATDPCGNLWLSGGMQTDSIVFIDGNLYVKPAGSRDPMYLAGWNAAGHYISATLLPTGGDDASFINADGAGNVYIGGDYWGGPYTIGGVTLNDPVHKYEDISVFKYQTVYVRDSTLKNTLVCMADSTVLQAPPGYKYYRWENGSTNPVRTVYAPGAYTVYATGRCGSGVLKDVFNVGYGRLDTAYTSQDTSACTNAQSVLQAPGGYTAYYWSNGGTSILDTINASGAYIAVCSGTCTIPTLYDTFKVKPNDIDLYFSLGDDTAICTPLTLSVHVPGASFIWQDGSTGNTDVAAQSGVYSATAYQQNCFHSDSVGVEFLNLAQSLQDTLFCKDRPIELTLHANVPANAKALWNTGNTHDSITVTYPGRYWVTVTEAACTGSDTMTLGEVICACSPVLPEAFTPNNDGKNDYFYPIIEKGCYVYDYTFCIYNRWGQLIFSTHDPDDKWDGKYFRTPQDLGTYMYYVEYRVEGSYYKFIKKGDVTLIK